MTARRGAAGLALTLLAGACTLDASGLVADSDLAVHVDAVPAGTVAVAVRVRDATGHEEARRAVVQGTPLVVYVSGLELGPSVVRTATEAADGSRITCREDGVVVAERRQRLELGVASNGVESGDEACSDGLDNDCEGGADCADQARCRGAQRLCALDPDCMGVQRCEPSQTWSTCSMRVGTEKAAAVCGDGFDNDCDAAIDCDDSDCHCMPGCPCP